LVWLGLCRAERVRLNGKHAADPALPRTLPLEHRQGVQVVRWLQIVVQLAYLFLLRLPRSLSPSLFRFDDRFVTRGTRFSQFRQIKSVNESCVESCRHVLAS
jgi:hypothetical protein